MLPSTDLFDWRCDPVGRSYPSKSVIAAYWLLLIAHLYDIAGDDVAVDVSPIRRPRRKPSKPAVQSCFRIAHMAQLEKARAAMDLYRSASEVWEAAINAKQWPCTLPPDAFANYYT
jgi:hypothetical protein